MEVSQTKYKGNEVQLVQNEEKKDTNSMLEIVKVQFGCSWVVEEIDDDNILVNK